jgi:hypothetical protein
MMHGQQNIMSTCLLNVFLIISQVYSATLKSVNGVGGDSMLTTKDNVPLFPMARTVCVRTIIKKRVKGTNCTITTGL